MNYIGLVLFLITGIKLVQMLFFWKTFKWLSDDSRDIDLHKGKYDVIIFRKINNLKQVRNLNFNVCDVNTKEAIEVLHLQIPFSSLSNFKTFYRVGKFKLDSTRTIQGSIRGLENLNFTGSRLFLKNLLFPKRMDGRIYIGVTRSFDLLLFLALIVVNVASLFLALN